MQGDLTRETLADVIRSLYVNRKSGILHLSQGEVAKRIYFRKGSMIFANSDIDGDRLGEFLIREGVIDRAAFERASASMRETGNRFGRTLVELGYVTAEQMESKVVEQIQAIIYSLFGWESGAYRFERHENPVDEDIMLNLSTADIILEGTRRMEDMDRVRRGLGPTSRVLQTTEDPLLLFQKMSTLSQAEYFILDRVDGSSSIEEILSLSPIGEDDALRCLYGLLSAGVVVAKGGGGAGPRAPEPVVPERVASSPSFSAGSPTPPPPPDASPRPVPETRVAHGAFDPAPSRPEPSPVRAAPPPPPPPPSPALEDPRPTVEPPSDPHGPSAEEIAVRDDIIEKHASLTEGTLYDLLGISATASDVEVKKAYYAMAKKYHPDRHHSPYLRDVHGLLEELFGKITQAYGLLSTPPERKRYDAKLRADGSVTGPEDASARAASASESARKRAADEHYREARRHFDEMHFFDAIQCLREAVRLYPTKTYHKLLAQSLMRNPKWTKEAEEQFRLALKMDRFDADCYVGLGDIYENAGMSTRAQKMYEQALSYDPENEAARKKLASRESAGSLGGFKKIFGRKKE